MNDVIWRQFELSAPYLAQLGRERYERTKVALLGSLRRDGSPRISPVGPHLVLGHLLFGVMRSAKAHDLLRDPRCVLHSSVSDVNGSEGEFKLYGRAVLVDDSRIRDGDSEAWWRSHPPDAAYVFSMDIDSAAFIGWEIGSGRFSVMRWSPRAGLTESVHEYP